MAGSSMSLGIDGAMDINDTYGEETEEKIFQQMARGKDFGGTQTEI